MQKGRHFTINRIAARMHLFYATPLHFLKKSYLRSVNVVLNKASQMESNSKFDVTIIGAGAAGLSAALFLTRACRSVVIFDAGSKRIPPTAKMHELIGFEGKTPEMFFQTAEAEVEQYGGIFIREKVIEVAANEDNTYIIYSEKSKITTRALVIATGLVDLVPEIPGLTEGWGTDIHVCPCFTGYELHQKKVVVFGLQERIGQLSKFLTAWTKRVTVITPQDFERDILVKLKTVGVNIVKAEVAAVVRENGKLKSVLTTDGKEIDCDGVFVSAPMKPAADIVSSLCDVDELGFAKTDELGKTTRQGLWVIGNASDPIGHLAHAIAAGTKVGPMVVDHLLEMEIATRLNSLAS
jgi:thioredoxin reductase